MSTSIPSVVGGEARPLTIIIIDARSLIRDCLANSLRVMDESFVVLTFASTDEWRTAHRAYSSGVIVIGTQDRLPHCIEHDLAQIADIRAEFPAVIISDDENVEHIRSAFAVGARGYIPTSVTLSVAVEAMRLVDAGGTFVPAKLLEQPNDTAFKRPQSVFTARQAAVLDGLKQGKANKRIAHELNMREGTVKVHVRNIMRKVSAKNRTEVALWFSNGLTNRGNGRHQEISENAFIPLPGVPGSRTKQRVS
jgi:DNA-binding NarL/FixJ family response regulator